MSYEPPTSHNPLFGQPGVIRCEDNGHVSEQFRQAHNDLKMVVPQKHWGLLTTKFSSLGGISPVETFMRGGRSTLETIKSMFPEHNVGA